MVVPVDFGIDVIIESDRDRRTLDYLVQTCGIDRVRRARYELPGRTRSYVSNLAKALGITVPEDIIITSREDGRRHLDDLKALLREKRRPA